MKMTSQSSRQTLSEVQQAFNRKYPYLRVEWVRQTGEIQRTEAFPLRLAGEAGGNRGPAGEGGYAVEKEAAGQQLLESAVGMQDDMKVRDLENALLRELGIRVQVFRKSGNYWMETRMTSHWTLKQQNDHGREISL
jgi:hypothetical protein